METFLARARVVMSSAVTLLAMIGAVVAIVVDELTRYVDVHPAVDLVVRSLGVLAAVVAVSIAILRRIMAIEITKAPADQRGILPPPTEPGPVELPRLPPRQ